MSLRSVLNESKTLKKNIFISLWLCLVLGISMQASAVSDEVIKSAWTPPAELLGDGDYLRAIHRMREIIELQEALLFRSQSDINTNQFVDQLWDSFEHFDLSRFFQALPVDQGDWRVVSLSGQREGDAYHFYSYQGVTNGFDGVSDLGDFRFKLQMKETDDALLKRYFLVQSKMKVGVGATDWQSVLDAGESALDLISKTDVIREDGLTLSGEDHEIKEKIMAVGPSLTQHEVRILVPIWAAFPNLWELYSRLGQVNDIVFNDDAERTRHHIRIALSLDLPKMKQQYPLISQHLRRLDKLVTFKTKMIGKSGQLMSVSFDSQTMAAVVELYFTSVAALNFNASLMPSKFDVQDHGFLETVKSTQDKSKRAIKQFQFITDIKLDTYGIVSEIKGLRTKVSYDVREKGAVVFTQTNSLPQVLVQGNAWGILPASMINFFIPGNIEGLINDFLLAASRGNGGNGVTSRIAFDDGQAQAVSTVAVDLSIETMDNFLVRLGMGIINDRIIPDESVSEEIDLFVGDAQSAFSDDLERFERIAFVAAPKLNGL